MMPLPKVYRPDPAVATSAVRDSTIRMHSTTMKKRKSAVFMTPSVAEASSNTLSAKVQRVSTGFKTAKGSAVSISAESQQRASKLLHQHDDSINISSRSIFESTGTGLPLNAEYHRGYASKINPNALTSTVSTPMVAASSSQAVPSAGAVSMFKTAKGSSVMISEKSLSKAQAFLHQPQSEGRTVSSGDGKSSRQIAAMTSTVSTPLVAASSSQAVPSFGVVSGSSDLQASLPPVALLPTDYTNAKQLDHVLGAVLCRKTAPTPTFLYSLSQMSQSSIDMPLSGHDVKAPAAEMADDNCKARVGSPSTIGVTDDLPEVISSRKRQLELPRSRLHQSPPSTRPPQNNITIPLVSNDDAALLSSADKGSFGVGQSLIHRDDITPDAVSNVIEATPRGSLMDSNYSRSTIVGNNVVQDTSERLKQGRVRSTSPQGKYHHNSSSPQACQIDHMISCIGTPILKSQKENVQENRNHSQVYSGSLCSNGSLINDSINCDIMNTSMSVETSLACASVPELLVPNAALAVDYNSLFSDGFDSSGAVTMEQLFIRVSREKRLSILRKLNSSNIMMLEINCAGDYADTFLSRAPHSRMYPIEELSLPYEYQPQLRAYCGSQLLNDVLAHVSVVSVSHHMVEWVAMQLKWILWTFASYERTEPEKYLGKLLMRSNIFDAISYRFSQYTHSWNVDGIPSMTIRKFKDTKGSGSMSPLQRCVDIHSLVFPLVLCVAMTPREPSKVQGTGSASCISLTDGWWWVRVKVDTDINTRLIETGKLKEGDKVVVFAATFEESDDHPMSLGGGVETSGHSGRTVMKLYYNAVRKARNNAKVGCVAPRYLNRGLSIASILTTGGVAFAVSVIPQYISPLNVKVTISHQSASDGSSKTDVHYLSTKEFELFEKHHGSGAFESHDDGERELEQLLEDNEEVSLPYLIEYELQCESWIREALMAIESGSENCLEFANEAEQQELFRAMDKVRRLQQDGIRNLLAKDRARRRAGGDSTIRVTSFVDVLVRCTLSQTMAWIRCTCGEDIEQGITVSRDLSEKAPTGNVVLISHLRPVATGTGGDINGQVRVLEMTASSNIKLLSSSTCSRVVVDPPISMNIRTIQSSAAFPYPDQSLNCVVIDIVARVEDDSSCVKDSLKHAYFEMHAISDDLVTVLLKWPMTSGVINSMASSMNKKNAALNGKSILSFPSNIEPGNYIRIRYGTVVMYDDKHNVLSMCRGEHTTVDIVGLRPEGRDCGVVLVQSTLPMMQWRGSLVSSLETSSVAGITHSEGDDKREECVNMVGFSSLLEHERRRLASLRQGKLYFNLLSDVPAMGSKRVDQSGCEEVVAGMPALCEACTRRYLLGATVQLQNDSDLGHLDVHTDTLAATVTSAAGVVTPNVNIHRCMLSLATEASCSFAADKSGQCWSGGVADVVITDRVYLDSDGGTSTRTMLTYLKIL